MYLVLSDLEMVLNLSLIPPAIGGFEIDPNFIDLYGTTAKPQAQI